MQAAKAEQQETSSSQPSAETDMQFAADALDTSTDQPSNSEETAVPLVDRLAGVLCSSLLALLYIMHDRLLFSHAEMEADCMMLQAR